MQLSIVVYVFALVAVALGITPETRIAWSGNPAKTYQIPSGSPVTILYGSGSATGTQILYQKLTNVTNSAPLVTVYLQNVQLGLSFSLQTGFSTIDQTCSCYYIDAHEQITAHPEIVDSNTYQIQFKSPDQTASNAMDLSSGYFGIRHVYDPNYVVPTNVVTTATATGTSTSQTTLPTIGTVSVPSSAPTMKILALTFVLALIVALMF